MKQCRSCGMEFTPISNQKWCKSCQEKPRVCPQCKQEFLAIPGSPKVFCGRPCASKWQIMQPEYRANLYTKERNAKISEAKKRWNAENPDAVARFIERSRANPSMHNPVSKAKVVAALKRIGNTLKFRGGNGTGPTTAENALMKILEGHSPQLNFPVRTNMKSGSGYPTSYKVDVAIPSLKLAIEADGKSHMLIIRKMQDLKKTAFLQALGWTVLRFKNSQILDFPEATEELLKSIILKLKDTQVTASMAS